MNNKGNNWYETHSFVVLISTIKWDKNNHKAYGTNCQDINIL